MNKPVQERHIRVCSMEEALVLHTHSIYILYSFPFSNSHQIFSWSICHYVSYIIFSRWKIRYWIELEIHLNILIISLLFLTFCYRDIHFRYMLPCISPFRFWKKKEYGRFGIHDSKKKELNGSIGVRRDKTRGEYSLRIIFGWCPLSFFVFMFVDL